MTVPFLEVVFHTINEVFKRPDFGPERQIRLVRVQPVDKLEEEEITETSTSTSSTLVRLSGRLLLPISALIFTITFWIVGLVKSYSSGNTHGVNMLDCLLLDLS